MLGWQKKRKEEAEAKLAAAKKEMESVNTGVIDDKTTNDEILKQAVEPEKEEESKTIQLDAVEIGILNRHKIEMDLKLQTLELLQKIYDKLEEINKKA